MAIALQNLVGSGEGGGGFSRSISVTSKFVKIKGWVSLFWWGDRFFTQTHIILHMPSAKVSIGQNYHPLSQTAQLTHQIT